MVSSMDDSGHSGARMSSAMSAIVQTSLREFFFPPSEVNKESMSHALAAVLRMAGSRQAGSIAPTTSLRRGTRP
jgi:hypothetical protein